ASPCFPSRRSSDLAGEVDDEASVPDGPRHGGRVLKAAVDEEHAHAGRGGEGRAERRSEGLALAGDLGLEVAARHTKCGGEAVAEALLHLGVDVDMGVARGILAEHQFSLLARTRRTR